MLSVAAETADEFWKIFNQNANDCQSRMSNLASLPPGGASTSEELKDCKSKLLEIQKYVTLSTKCLPPYDIRRSQEIVERMNKEYKDIEGKVQPKKKFAFSKKKAANIPESNPSSQDSNVKNQPSIQKEAKSVDLLPPGSFVIDGKSQENIVVSQADFVLDESTLMQLYIKSCNGCTITIGRKIGSVRIETISDCIVFLGPCATSVYLEGAKNCTIFLACHQLRIHNCENCNLYVRAASHPIIEDCIEMGFAPYTLSYIGMEDDISSCGLQNADHWSDVVDFKWHKSIASPNWRIIREDERLAPPVLK